MTKGIKAVILQQEQDEIAAQHAMEAAKAEVQQKVFKYFKKYEISHQFPFVSHKLGDDTILQQKEVEITAQCVMNSCHSCCGTAYLSSAVVSDNDFKAS